MSASIRIDEMEGKEVPAVDLLMRLRTGEDANGSGQFDWKTISSTDNTLFGSVGSKRRVVLFAIPGAFTPTCSATHLPGYHNNYDNIKTCGIDEVYCLSVNDAFVMRKWGIDQGLEPDINKDGKGVIGTFKTVKLIPDGAAAFTQAVGATCLWDIERGFGERSWRYSAVISDGKFEKIFVEENKKDNSEPDPFKCSDENTMLNYLEGSRDLSKDASHDVSPKSPKSPKSPTVINFNLIPSVKKLLGYESPSSPSSPSSSSSTSQKGGGKKVKIQYTV